MKDERAVEEEKEPRENAEKRNENISMRNLTRNGTIYIFVLFRRRKKETNGRFVVLIAET